MLPVAPPTSTIEAKRGEVIGLGNRRRLRSMDADHGFAELRSQLRMLRQVVENRHAEDLFHRGLAGLDRILKLSPGLPHPRSRHRENRRSCRARGIALERIAERRQAERVILSLRQDAEACERPHESMTARVG